MLLVHQHIVFDIPDRKRTIAADQLQHLAQVRWANGAEPFVSLAFVTLHRRNKVAKMFRGHIGQRMGPVFEHALVDTLGMAQVRATIFGDTAPQNVMVTALHDVDGVDLHITEMFHGSRNSLRSIAERRAGIEPLGAQPDAPGRSLGQRVEFLRAGHRASM